jgi:DNA mismatch repair protein MSH3
LASRYLIESRQEAVEFFVDHYNDIELVSFKKFLKCLPDLEKQLTAVYYIHTIIAIQVNFFLNNVT